LPITVAEGTDEDETHRVLTTTHGPEDGSRAASSTFNRRFDILFKQDAQCRVNGRLHLIRRGEVGMLLVVRYLRDTKWNDPEMNLEGAVNKLERIVTSMLLRFTTSPRTRSVRVVSVARRARLATIPGYLLLPTTRVTAGGHLYVDTAKRDPFLEFKPFIEC
jgi:hypothetical protein